MVENDNQMTMDDFDKLIADNPPGTVPPLQEDNPPAAQADTNNNTSATATAANDAQTQVHTDQQAGNNNSSNPQSTDNQKRSANDAFAAMLKKLDARATNVNIVMTASIAVDVCPDSIKAYA